MRNSARPRREGGTVLRALLAGIVILNLAIIGLSFKIETNKLQTTHIKKNQEIVQELEKNNLLKKELSKKQIKLQDDQVAR